ncbi:MAG TPA: 50S ribosomal protein L17 [Anaerolineae bacterium]|nr:50S ribosomal protein L17 [Anaerolineae bacterium]HQK13528.1 50S ribosomal protein L17 [Anaerolineae bacterium]
MRHRVAGKKLSRPVGQRTALRRNLVTELFRHNYIRTTRAKAEAIQGQAEKLITLAKRGLLAGATDPAKEVHARRLAAARLNDPAVVQKLFNEIAPQFQDRPGGYTQMLKLGMRKGDAAPIVLLKLVED